MRPLGLSFRFHFEVHLEDMRFSFKWEVTGSDSLIH